MGHTLPLYNLILIFTIKHQSNFVLQINVKNVHPVYGSVIRTHDLQIASLIP